MQPDQLLHQRQADAAAFDAAAARAFDAMEALEQVRQLSAGMPVPVSRTATSTALPSPSAGS